MPWRVAQAFDPQSGGFCDEDRKQVIRDVYLRMDEVVGKAFSFVDDETALLVVVADCARGQSFWPPFGRGLLFCNWKLAGAGARGTDLAESVRELLRDFSPTND
jgi:hypothetical protein